MIRPGIPPSAPEHAVVINHALTLANQKYAPAADLPLQCQTNYDALLDLRSCELDLIFRSTWEHLVCEVLRQLHTWKPLNIGYS
jgi:hypothetical protein